jgi:hypothetical protein
MIGVATFLVRLLFFIFIFFISINRGLLSMYSCLLLSPLIRMGEGVRPTWGSI